MTQKKYDRHGSEFRLTTLKEGECLAWSQCQDADGPYDDAVRIVKASELFDEPPRIKFHSEIAKLQDRLNDLRGQLRAQQREIAAFEEADAERIAKLKQHKGLEQLEDFLAGRITHFVECECEPPRIIPSKNAKRSYNHRTLKLLTLFGDSKGNLAWSLNSYSDGSGYSITVVPCTSYEAAIRETKKRFALHESDVLDPKSRFEPSRKWLEQAEEYGIEMSDAYVRRLAEHEEAARQTEIMRLESRLKTLRPEEETKATPCVP